MGFCYNIIYCWKLRFLEKGLIMARRGVVKKFRLNGETVVFRYPVFSDCDDLLRNFNSLIEERAFIASEKKQTKAGKKKWLAGLLKDVKKKNKVVLAVVIGKRVVGLAHIDKNTDASFSHVGSFGIGLIKIARGRGIGQRLLMAVVAEAKKVLKIKIVTLWAFAKNRIAINCYRKCGFVKTETMKGGIKHYGEYLDRIRMVKYL